MDWPTIIASGVLGTIGGTLSGAAGGYLASYYAEKHTDRRRAREAEQVASKAFADCNAIMPELFKEMRDDLRSSPHAREFILIRQKAVYCDAPNKIVLRYFYEKHDSLAEKAERLCAEGFAADIQFNDVPRYRMTEDLVRRLLQE